MGRFEFLCIGVPSATTPPKANGAQFRSDELVHWLDADLKDSESCCQGDASPSGINNQGPHSTLPQPQLLDGVVAAKEA